MYKTDGNSGVLELIKTTGKTDAAPGPQGEPMLLELSTLYVDPIYQRELNAGHIQFLVQNWDLSAAGPITVNVREDGTVALLDGQHRAEAARRVGLDTLLAIAYFGLTQAEEARKFTRLNGARLGQTPLVAWNAALAGDERAHRAIDQVVRSLGMRVAKRRLADPPELLATTLSCPGALLTIAYGDPKKMRRTEEMLRPERVRAALSFLKECWPGDPMAPTEQMVLGVYNFLQRYGALVDLNAAGKKFSLISVAQVFQRASAIRAADAVHSHVATARALQRFYDAGRRTRRLEAD